MTALREQIFALIEERLGGIAGVSEVERMPSSDPVSFPALHIFDGGQAPDWDETGVTRYDMTVVVEGFLEASGGAEAHKALNALYVDVVTSLMTEPPLDGLAETIDEGGFRPAVAPLASVRRLGFSLTFQITFPTERGDPAQPA
ncbi:hypothetical protein [Sphingomonas nostoxanthinifaciens]|uniref:hypothetical protein n=1 Tax=Sphingomonas nostoxanthinifaciens TaxID=2872652 RepID=UPI001CC1C819|nr:hypothetical protein [Sphingomonas nostoxanthinifaciens]UAK24349.1 hypothetical protein K8P63_18885 [Sphingomonas nostoxanthinifaciens]